MYSQIKDSHARSMMDALHYKMGQLERGYHDALVHETIVEEVSDVKFAAQACLDGSPHATQFMHEQAEEMLEHIHDKLVAMTQEQSRLNDESPQCTREDEEQVMQMSRAVALVGEAQEILNPLREQL